MSITHSTEGAKTLIIAVLTAVVFLFIFKDCHNKSVVIENNLLKNSIDTLHKTKNKDGSETAYTKLLQANIKQFEKLESFDNSIKSLQEEVKKYKSLLGKSGSVSVFSTTTIYQGTATTSISGNTLNPIYTASNKDTTWTKWNVRASRDSTHLSLFIKNAYSVIIGQKRYGFLKLKTEPIVEVVNKNPYSSTTALRAFQVQYKPKRFSIGIQLTYGITPKGLQPCLGIGGTFKLIDF